MVPYASPADSRPWWVGEETQNDLRETGRERRKEPVIRVHVAGDAIVAEIGTLLRVHRARTGNLDERTKAVIEGTRERALQWRHDVDRVIDKARAQQRPVLLEAERRFQGVVETYVAGDAAAEALHWTGAARYKPRRTQTISREHITRCMSCVPRTPFRRRRASGGSRVPAAMATRSCDHLHCNTGRDLRRRLKQQPSPKGCSFGSDVIRRRHPIRIGHKAYRKPAAISQLP